MFLIQRIQVWLANDGDDEEEELPEMINTMLAILFAHLAPIVQELSGAHWDLIFDIIELNLEVSFWFLSSLASFDTITKGYFDLVSFELGGRLVRSK